MVVRIGLSGLSVSNPTGLGRLARIYLIALANAAPDWELHVYFRSPACREALLAECDRDTCGCCEAIVAHYPPMPGLNRVVLEEYDLPRQFAKLDLDAYLGCDFTLPGWKVARREYIVFPDMLPFTKPGTVNWRAQWLYRRGIKRSLARQAQVVTISSYSANTLSTLFPQSAAAKVIYPALSPRLWRFAQNQEADHALQVRGTFANIQRPGPFILSVGVAGKRKNTRLLVETHTNLVRQKSYQGSLVLVGGDSGFHTAPRTGKSLAIEAVGYSPSSAAPGPQVYDIGRVSDYDLSQLYHGADLLVSLSTEEGFGFPVLEALAHGTPALVTKGSSMVEIANTGIVQTPLNKAECLSRLKSTLGALEILRREALQLDVGQYSIGRLGNELAELLSGGTDVSKLL